MYTSAPLIAGTNRRPICCLLAMRWSTVTAIDHPLLILLKINNWCMCTFTYLWPTVTEGDLTNKDEEWLVTWLGCDHIGHKPYRPQPYRPQQDDIGHSKKQYRPHGKSISATTISAKTISATKYTASLFGVIVSILLCFVYRPSLYREFERETAH